MKFLKSFGATCLVFLVFGLILGLVYLLYWLASITPDAAIMVITGVCLFGVVNMTAYTCMYGDNP